MFQLLDHWLVLLLGIPALLLGYDHIRARAADAGASSEASSGDDGPTLLWRGLAATLCAIYPLRMAGWAWERIHDELVWDFAVFWVQGRALLQGIPLYEPYHGLIELPMEIGPEDDFMAEIMNVGGYYHPHAMPLMAAIGYPPYEIAHALWLLAMAAVTAACVWGVWKLCLAEDRIDGLLLVGALFSLYIPANETLGLAQWNFVFIGLLALYWHHRKTAIGGSIIALGFMIKPWFAILGVHALLERRWVPALTAIGGFLALSLFALAVVGSDDFFGYFATNVAERGPDWMPIQIVEQSLAAVLGRAQDLVGADVYANPVYRVSALLLMIVSVAVAWFRRDDREFEAMALIMVAGLICYPATLYHYSTVLLFPIVYAWSQRHARPGATLGAAVFLGALYALSAVDYGLAFGFATLVAAWCALVVGTLVPARRAEAVG